MMLLLNEYSELQQLMYKTTGVISPNKFVYGVQLLARKKNRDLFTGWAQNDISEFLLFLFDSLHNSVSRNVNIQVTGTVKNQKDKIAKKCYEMLQEVYSKEYSEIIETFYGIYFTKIISKDNDKIHSVKPEHYFLLDLQIFHDKKIVQTYMNVLIYLLNRKLCTEIMLGIMKKPNKKKMSINQTLFWNLPEILIIILKRFSIDGTRKIQTHIDFPINNLDLSSYVSGYKSNNYVYDLYGVCNHSGSIMGGHYTAYVKIHQENGFIIMIHKQLLLIIRKLSLKKPIVYSIVKKTYNSILYYSIVYIKNMENSTVKQDKLSEVLNKSNVMVLVMFLAIYFVIYFLMDVFNKEQSTENKRIFE